LKYAVLVSMAAVDKKYREKEHDANRDATSDIAYKRYMANNGVHPLMMRSEQAVFLNTFSADAQLFYLAFAFVDGTDGIANGIARHILSYIGITISEAAERRRRRELEEEVDLRESEEQIDTVEEEQAASQNHDAVPVLKVLEPVEFFRLLDLALVTATFGLFLAFKVRTRIRG
jgi:hypothetical protein